MSTDETLKEELFHAWQDAFYPGDISQYLSVGKVNIEFEAKVFSDLFGNPDAGCCYAFRPGVDNLPDNLYNDYTRWAYNIRENKITLQDSDYQKWLNLFNQYNKEYSSPMHSSLNTPNAIKNLIHHSDCY